MTEIFLRIYISGKVIKKIEIILRTKYHRKHYALDVLHIFPCYVQLVIFHKCMKSLFLDINQINSDMFIIR